MCWPETGSLSDRRYQAYLADRYRVLAGYCGVLFRLLGLLIAAPAFLALIYPGQADMALAFLCPGLGLALLGVVLRLPPGRQNTLSIAEGAAIVVVAWVAAILAGAVPFYWAGLGLTQALFEATSGWTTTGLSVLAMDGVSPLLLFFRSLMQLAGGAGLAILMLSAINSPAGVGLSTAEGRAEQLVPQVRHSARLVLQLYLLYVLFGIAALRWAGMTWFEAVNHTFCAVSTGGFSTQTDSIAFWNNPAIEGVLMVLMILGATNFLTVYTLGHGRLRAGFRNGELRVLALLLPLAVLLLFGAVTLTAGNETTEPLRRALFQAVTALSTTGYATQAQTEWPAFGLLITIMLMLIGGGTGSTAGGIKLHRVFLLAKGLKREVTGVFLPPHLVQEELFLLGNQRRFLTDSDLRKTGIYIALYLFTWLVGGCALTAFGHPLADSLFEFASALGTVGLSVGITSAQAPAGLLWVEIVGMLLGRLEFFVIFWGILKIGRDLAHLLPHRRPTP
jgi:trk system potassium uptake protein TrkH